MNPAACSLGTDGLREFFCGWTKENIWIFVVDVLILVLIFFREYLWDGFIGLRNIRRASTDHKVMTYLGSLDRGVKKTVEEIVVGISGAKKSKPEKVKGEPATTLRQFSGRK